MQIQTHKKKHYNNVNNRDRDMLDILLVLISRCGYKQRLIINFND